MGSLLVLAVGAVTTVALARWPRTALAASLGSAGLAGLLCCTAALRALATDAPTRIWSAGGSLPLGTMTFTLDGLTAWFLLTIGVSVVAAAIYAWGYFQGEAERGPAWAAGALLDVLVAAMVITVCAADVVGFLVGWELMSLSAFLLVGFHHRDAETRRGAWMYLVATHLGTAFFVLPMFGMLVARAETTAFAAFHTALAPCDAGVCTLVFLLALLGFGTKAGFMPMHVWLPVAHPAAPTPVSALLSGVVIKTGIYGLLRLLSWLPVPPVRCAVVMLAFGMVSGVLGVLYALAQHDIKRLLAYHSVENIGIIGLGIGMGMLGQALDQPALLALGYGGALLHVLNHAFFKGLLFLSAGAVIHATGTGQIERLGGLARSTPINALLFLVAALSICGLPPFNGFVSEWMVYGSLFGGTIRLSASSAGVAAIGAVSLALMGGLALACFAKVFSVVFLGVPRDASLPAHPTPISMLIGMCIPAALCAAIGLLPGPFVSLTASGVGAVAGLSAAEFAGSTATLLASAGHLSLLGAVLLGFVLALVVVRRALLGRTDQAPVTGVVTWGCGYARPSARMQYTASSFAWPLVESFRHLLWPERKFKAPTGVFAGHAKLESHTPDLAEHDFFAPLLRGVGRLFRMIRSLSWTGEPVAEMKGEPRAERVGPPAQRVCWGDSAPSAAERTLAEVPPRRGPIGVLVTSVVTALRRGSIHVYLAFIALTLLVVFFIEAVGSPTAATPPAVPVAGIVDGVVP